VARDNSESVAQHSKILDLVKRGGCCYETFQLLSLAEQTFSHPSLNSGDDDGGVQTAQSAAHDDFYFFFILCFV
jgi:hypothetical protein